jgi:hypothetical protein
MDSDVLRDPVHFLVLDPLLLSYMILTPLFSVAGLLHVGIVKSSTREREGCRFSYLILASFSFSSPFSRITTQ